MTKNQFISGNYIPTEEKKAIGHVLAALAIICAGKEDQLPPGIKSWLAGNAGLCGSIREREYRTFLNFVLTEKKKNPLIVSHPYLVPTMRLIDIEKPSARLDKYALSSSPEIFNMDRYLNLVCEKDVSGKIIGLNKNMVNGDDKFKHELSEAFNQFFGYVKTFPITASNSSEHGASK